MHSNHFVLGKQSLSLWLADTELKCRANFMGNTCNTCSFPSARAWSQCSSSNSSRCKTMRRKKDCWKAASVLLLLWLVLWMRHLGC